MRSVKPFAVAAFALSAVICLLSATPAQAQGPRYLHALATLRQARAWIRVDTRPQYADLRHHAQEEIDHAIDEVKKAAHDDGTNTNWVPPPAPPGQNPSAPILSGINMLNMAHRDVAAGQDQPENAGLQAQALQHIDAAREALHRIRQLSGAEPYSPVP